MDFPPISSQGWVEKIVLVLTGGGLVGLFRLILYRKKPQSEINRLDAETENTRIEGSIKASNQIMRLTDRINQLDATIETSQREAVNTARFFQSQLKYFEELDLVYRKRSHAIHGELGNQGMAMRVLEMKYAQATGKAVEPYKLKTLDEIIEEYPLPESAGE